MVSQYQSLDPDRRRRRLRLITALAGAKAQRERANLHLVRTCRLRQVIATRRALVG